MTINVKNFLKDKPKLSKMGEFQDLQPIEGMEISAVSADLYGTGRDDLCLFYFKDEFIPSNIPSEIALKDSIRSIEV